MARWRRGGGVGGGIIELGDRWSRIGLVFKKGDVSPRFSARNDQQDAQRGFFLYPSKKHGRLWLLHRWTRLNRSLKSESEV